MKLSNTSPLIFSLLVCIFNSRDSFEMSVGSPNSNLAASPGNAITFEATYANENSILHQPLIQKYTIKSLGWFTYGGHVGLSDYQSGIYDMHGKRAFGFGSDYNVITLENGHFVSKAFNVRASGVKSLSEYLQRIPFGKSVIIATSDEPHQRRLDAPLPDLIYQFGGSKKVFEESIVHHSAYVLFGTRGLGEGKGQEYYKGLTTTSTDSIVMTNFFVAGDVIIPESELGLSLVDTFRVIGTKTSILRSPMWLSDASKSKPIEVTEMEDKRTNNGKSKMKLSILF